MRVLIYNGDADLCVPYKGNEELAQISAPVLSGKSAVAAAYAKGLPEGAGGYVTTPASRQDVPSKARMPHPHDPVGGTHGPTFNQGCPGGIARFFRGEAF